MVAAGKPGGRCDASEVWWKGVRWMGSLWCGDERRRRLCPLSTRSPQLRRDTAGRKGGQSQRERGAERRERSGRASAPPQRRSPRPSIAARASKHRSTRWWCCTWRSIGPSPEHQVVAVCIPRRASRAVACYVLYSAARRSLLAGAAHPRVPIHHPAPEPSSW